MTRPLTSLCTLLALALPASVAFAQVQPSAARLAAAHDSIVGGRAALEAHTAIRITGSFEIPEMGMKAPLEIMKRRPSQYLMRVTLPVGEVLSGFDGEHAWRVQPGMGATLLPAAAAEQMRTQADFFGDLHDYSLFVTATSLPADLFEGRRAWPVRLVRASGDTLTEYFDAETGLSAGTRISVATPSGRAEMLSVVSDYKDFGGLRVATRIEQRTPQSRLILTITSVTFDSLTARDLEPPESVRALIKP